MTENYGSNPTKEKFSSAKASPRRDNAKNSRTNQYIPNIIAHYDYNGVYLDMGVWFQEVKVSVSTIGVIKIP